MHTTVSTHIHINICKYGGSTATVILFAEIVRRLPSDFGPPACHLCAVNTYTTPCQEPIESCLLDP